MTLGQVLRDLYGLASDAITQLPLGVVNLNYRVDIGEKAYVLKHYAHKGYTLDEVRSGCEAQALVRKAGVPTPAIVPTHQGEFVAQTPEGFYVLSEFIDGRQYELGRIPRDAARSMGQTLGQLIETLAKLEPIKPYTVPDLPGAMARLESTLQRAEARRGSDPLDDVACQNLRYRLETLPRYEGYPAKFATLRPQWVHGDYQHTNIIFGPDDSVAAVIDFDNLRCRLRAFEIMRAFAYSFAQGQSEAFDFFAGCVDVLQPSLEEVSLFVPVWTYISLANHWPLDARYHEADNYQTRWDRFIRPPSTWWESQGESVTERFVQIVTARGTHGAAHPV